MHVHAAKMPVMSSGLKLGLQGFVLFGGLHACSMCEELRSCEDLLVFFFQPSEAAEMGIKRTRWSGTKPELELRGAHFFFFFLLSFFPLN